MDKRYGTRSGGFWRFLVGFAALMLVVAACGSSDSSSSATADAGSDAAEVDEDAGDTKADDSEVDEIATTTQAPATTTTEAPPTTEGAAEEPEPDAEAAVESPVMESVSAGPASFRAAGGIDLELGQAMEAIHSQQCVVLLDASYSGSSPFQPGVAIGSAAYLGRGEVRPISSIDDWFASYEGQPSPVATGETITLLGQELQGYRIDGAFGNGPPPDEAVLNCAVDAQTVSDLQMFAAVYSDLFVAETDAGLLVAMANGFTEEDQVRARELFDEIIPTIVANPAASESAVETTPANEIERLVEEMLPAGMHELPIVGGLTFELPEATTILTSGNCVLVEAPGYLGSSPFSPAVAVSLVLFSGITELTPISTIAEWLAIYEDQGQAVPEPIDETMSFLGQEMQGYRVDGAFLDGPPPQEVFLNCASSENVASEFGIIPAGFGAQFVAETDDGLLLVGYGGFTEDEGAMAKALFDEVAPTINATE